MSSIATVTAGLAGSDLSRAEINRANAQHSTGPRTEEGKAVSSRNAITHGLFSQHDYVPAGREPEYQNVVSSLTAELAGATAAEQVLVSEIVSAAWKLRRCAEAEAALSEHFPEEFLITEDPVAVRRQNSIDRARSRAHGIYTRSLAELRRLQTNRLAQTAGDSPIGLADPNRIQNAANSRLRHIHLEDRKETFDMLRVADYIPGAPASPALASFCTPPVPMPKAPRNAPCPCGSGLKFKRFCINKPNRKAA
jgi:hypothetical protein